MEQNQGCRETHLENHSSLLQDNDAQHKLPSSLELYEPQQPYELDDSLGTLVNNHKSVMVES